MKPRKVILQLELTTNVKKVNLVNLATLNSLLGELANPYKPETLTVDQATFLVAQPVKEG